MEQARLDEEYEEDEEEEEEGAGDEFRVGDWCRAEWSEDGVVYEVWCKAFLIEIWTLVFYRLWLRVSIERKARPRWESLNRLYITLGIMSSRQGKLPSCHRYVSLGSTTWRRRRWMSCSWARGRRGERTRRAGGKEESGFLILRFALPFFCLFRLNTSQFPHLQGGGDSWLDCQKLSRSLGQLWGAGGYRGWPGPWKAVDGD